MGKKILIALGMVFAVFVLYVVAVFVTAHFHNRAASANIARVNVGMSRKELDEIMGTPVRSQMTDGSGTVLCYTQYPFDDYDENCGISVNVSNDRVDNVGLYR